MVSAFTEMASMLPAFALAWTSIQFAPIDFINRCRSATTSPLPFDIDLLAQPAANAQGAVLLPDKEGLASLMGTTSRHLNRVLRELVDDGYISASYPLVHLNRAALEGLTQ